MWLVLTSVYGIIQQCITNFEWECLVIQNFGMRVLDYLDSRLIKYSNPMGSIWQWVS